MLLEMIAIAGPAELLIFEWFVHWPDRLVVYFGRCLKAGTINLMWETLAERLQAQIKFIFKVKVLEELNMLAILYICFSIVNSTLFIFFNSSNENVMDGEMCCVLPKPFFVKL